MPANPTKSSGRVECVCRHCGETFLVKRANVERGRGIYCSRTCRAKHVGKVECVCGHCGKTFLSWSYRLADGRGKYCSHACSAAATGNLLFAQPRPRQPIKNATRTCQQCGKTFACRASGPQQYCSRSCAQKSRTGERSSRWRNGHPLPHKQNRVDRTCEQCGTAFRVKASRVPQGFGRYCSVKCHNDARRLPDAETHRLRGSYRYAAWRTKVFTRDRYTCQRCGQVRGRLNAHHLQPWAKHPELRFDVSNGVTLCFSCHRAIHRSE